MMNPHIVQYFMSIWGCQNPLSCTVCFLVTSQCMTAGDGSVSKRGQDWYIGSVRDSLQPPSLPKNSFTPALPSCPEGPSLVLPGWAGLQHSWDLAPAPWASSMGQWRIPGCWSGCWRDSSFPTSFPGPVLLPPWLHKLFFFITHD